MSKDDPYDQGSRTVIRPQPGGRRSGNEAVQTTDHVQGYKQPLVQQRIANDRYDDFFQQRRSFSSTANAINLNATELLTLSAKLRHSVTHHNIDGLRRQIADSIKSFSSTLLQQGFQPTIVQDASYAICTLVDESVLNTPWGAHSTWGTQTLLAQFHGEAWGGENFFVKLDHFKLQPGTNLDILEFYYLCLSLGLQGRYRVLDHGMARLEDIREDLYQLIRRQKGGFERALSLHWQGAKNLRNTLSNYLPWWVIVAVSSALLLLIYLSFAWMSNDLSDPQFKRLDQIARDTNPYANEHVALVEYVPEPIEAPEQVKIEQRKHGLKELLAAEIEQGLVEVFDREGSVFIRTRGLFVSGNDQVMPEMKQLVDRIGQELNTMQGKILISGHTDNISIFNLRFTSNWALSKARAETVKNRLAELISSDVIFTVEGRADHEPVVANDTEQNRARNRRVEIIVTER